MDRLGLGATSGDLDRVVGLSRLLVRPGLGRRNLASKVLSSTMSALPHDFEQAYGY
ncbi:MAG: hypothetical protein ACU843_13440 [Gammaproteobacteria bacterium]